MIHRLASQSVIVANAKNLFGSALKTLLFTVLLASCAQLSQNLEQKPSTLALPAKWQTNGKLSLQASDLETGKIKRQTLRFSWQQNGGDYQIKLSGSFGVGTTIIQKESNTVSMRRGKSIISTASDAETLFAQHTGILLPVSQLEHWITGQRSGSNGTHQAPKNFRYNDWQVSYPSLTLSNGYAMPAKMIADNGVYTVTAIFNRWLFSETELNLAPNSATTETISEH